MAYAGDSLGYFVAWDNILQNGIDIIRTASYPIFIGVISKICGSYADYGIAIAQIAIFLVSVRYFWFLCYRVSSSKKITFWLTAIVALAPGISDYAITLLTESLSVSGVILLVTLLVKINDCFKYRYAVSIVLLTTFLVFMRPALLFLLVVFAVLFLILAKNRMKKQAATVFATLAVVLGSLYGYCKFFESKTGVFAMSGISYVNDEYLMFSEDITDRISMSDPVLSEFFDRLKSENSPISSVSWSWRSIASQEPYSLQVHRDFLNEAKHQLGLTWYNRALMRFYETSSSVIVRSRYFEHSNIFNAIYSIMPFKLSIVYYIIAVYGLILLLNLLKKREINWLSWTLLLSCCGQIAVMVIGSFSDWGRLFLPTFPLALIMLGQLISKLRVSVKYPF
jgi:hypothetical protein